MMGFSLVELIVVIVILSVLSVTALPKFFNVEHDARSAILNNIAGQMTSLNEMVHLKAAVVGKHSGNGNQYFDSNLGEINIWNGYLETKGEGGSRIGIFEIVGIEQGEGFTLSAEYGSGCTYRRGGFGDLGRPGSNTHGDECFVEYREACSLTDKYLIKIVDEGC